MAKGIVGVGCSYTWGEGLQFYADIPIPMRESHTFYEDELRIPHILFKNKYRFTNLVGEYYNTWSHVVGNNGGSNMGFIHHDLPNLLDPVGEINFNDIGLLIFQFTKSDRNFKNNHFSNEFINTIEEQIIFTDKILCRFEERGVSVVTISWDTDIPSHDLYKQLYKNRHVPIIEGELRKSAFDSLLWHKDYNYTVASDFHKYDLQKNDVHLNLKGHRVIADSIIEKLKKDNFTVDTTIDINKNYVNRNADIKNII